ncbi:MAG: biotin/lipoyl-binding protein [Haliscomenobacter sp.]|nr:biotin/lipoyl-binding protein [Haliscomenobacter sp.]
MKLHVALLACIAAMAMACQSKSKQETLGAAPEEVIPVRTAQAEERVLIFPVLASGVLTSEQEAKPGFKTGGVVKRIFVEEGDRVVKGQLLATLHMAEINAQAQQAEEGLAKAKETFSGQKICMRIAWLRWNKFRMPLLPSGWRRNPSKSSGLISSIRRCVRR